MGEIVAQPFFHPARRRHVNQKCNARWMETLRQLVRNITPRLNYPTGIPSHGPPWREQGVGPSFRHRPARVPHRQRRYRFQKATFGSVLCPKQYAAASRGVWKIGTVMRPPALSPRQGRLDNQPRHRQHIAPSAVSGHGIVRCHRFRMRADSSRRVPLRVMPTLRHIVLQVVSAALRYEIARLPDRPGGAARTHRAAHIRERYPGCGVGKS